MRHIDELKLKPSEVWYQQPEKVKDHCKDLPICEVATDALELIESYFQSLKDHNVSDLEEPFEGLKLLLEIIIEKDLSENEIEKPSLEDFAIVVLKAYSIRLKEIKQKKQEKKQVKITITADVDQPTF